jgi:hypothetical protein
VFREVFGETAGKELREELGEVLGEVVQVCGGGAGLDGLYRSGEWLGRLDILRESVAGRITVHIRGGSH